MWKQGTTNIQTVISVWEIRSLEHLRERTSLLKIQQKRKEHIFGGRILKDVSRYACSALVRVHSSIKSYLCSRDVKKKDIKSYILVTSLMCAPVNRTGSVVNWSVLNHYLFSVVIVVSYAMYRGAYCIMWKGRDTPQHTMWFGVHQKRMDFTSIVGKRNK